MQLIIDVNPFDADYTLVTIGDEGEVIDKQVLNETITVFSALEQANKYNIEQIVITGINSFAENMKTRLLTTAAREYANLNLEIEVI